MRKTSAVTVWTHSVRISGNAGSNVFGNIDMIQYTKQDLEHLKLFGLEAITEKEEQSLTSLVKLLKASTK